MQNPSHDLLMKACDRYLKQGFEGAMVKDLEASYKWGRGDNLLKVKKFYDADFKVKED
jgi:ATP-dependent DNA ligase